MDSIQDIKDTLTRFRSNPNDSGLIWMCDTLVLRMLSAKNNQSFTGYQLDVWILLGQVVQLCNARGIWEEEWGRRLEQITERNINEDLTFIIAEKIWDVAQQQQLDYENLGPASKFLRKLSYDYEENVDRYKSLLTRAVVLGERLLQTNEPTRMVLWNIGKAHLQLWASRVYQDETLRPTVIRDNREMYGGYPTEKQLIIYLTTGPYLVTVSGDNLKLVSIQQKRLRRAHNYLESIEHDFDAHQKSAPHLAKVKYLLGHSNSEVEELLVKSVGLPIRWMNFRDKQYLVNARTMLGRFYEKTNRPDEARTEYEKAVNLVDESDLLCPIARHRLSVLRDR